MKTCLIVDDSEIIRTVGRYILEYLYFSVQEAVNGYDALQICKSYVPDIILLDDHMPVMDGKQFLRSLQEVVTSTNATYPKIIFCTAEDNMTYIMDALRDGANDYLIKPFDKNTLQEKVQHLGLLADLPRSS